MFRIAVAEDEPLILQSICEKIRSVDPDFKIVGEYENGEYALLELELVKPHVLLTDIYMPVLDGLSLIEQAKKSLPSTVCAVLTGYRDFEYARKAIELGVSDYLLKPPTTDNISKFLADVKAKLWKNQALIEAELLRQWAYRKEEDTAFAAQTREWAPEYFYHTRYLVLYEWIPRPRAAASRENEDWGVEEHLVDGERLYRIPSDADSRRAIVVGVHGDSGERLQRLADIAAAAARAQSACVVAASVGRLPTELFAVLAKLHRRARSGFPLEGRRSLILKDKETAYEEPSLPIAPVQEQELVALLLKQRKSEFLRKLELLFQTEAWMAASRSQWLQSLVFLMNSWKLHHPELARKLSGIRWSEELEDAVWEAEDAASLAQSLKELHGSLFEALDPDTDREMEAPWTDELKHYLDTRYMDNISLADLAERCSLNASYLGRVFKRKYGHSPIDYLIQVRIGKAKQLIREKPRLLFKDVAELVGYADPFYFSKLFKQWTGQTPREYKKQPTME